MGILDLFRSKPEAAPSVAPKRAPRADWQYFDGLDGQGELPAARLIWDSIDDISVVGVNIEYWPANDPTQVFTRFVTWDVTNVLLVEGLTSLTDWFVRTRLRVDNGRSVAWSTATPFTTLKAAGDDIPVDYERLDEDVRGLINYMTDDMRELKRQAQELATTTSDNHNSNYADRQAIRRELTSTFGTAQAQWQEDILTATGPNSAIGQQLIQINVSLGEKADASTVSLLQSRVDNVDGQITAVSNALTEVNASVNDVSANATWRMTATAGTSGSVKIAAYGRLNTGSTWRQAGWFVNITPTGSQFVVLANQFAIADPNDDGSFTYPFVVQNGEVYAQNMRLGTLKFDQLQSNNGKLIIRGSGSLADLRIFT